MQPRGWSGSRTFHVKRRGARVRRERARNGSRLGRWSTGLGARGALPLPRMDRASLLLRQAPGADGGPELPARGSRAFVVDGRWRPGLLRLPRMGGAWLLLRQAPRPVGDASGRSAGPGSPRPPSNAAGWRGAGGWPGRRNRPAGRSSQARPSVGAGSGVPGAGRRNRLAPPPRDAPSPGCERPRSGRRVRPWRAGASTRPKGTDAGRRTECRNRYPGTDETCARLRAHLLLR